MEDLETSFGERALTSESQGDKHCCHENWNQNACQEQKRNKPTNDIVLKENPSSKSRLHEAEELLGMINQELFSDTGQNEKTDGM